MFNELLVNNPQDHIMANTWRLIFEHKSQPTTPKTQLQSVTIDFLVLEQLLPEYRLIGLCLADNQAHRRYN